MSGDRESVPGPDDNRRRPTVSGRRTHPRGGRRATDVAGRYPPLLVGDSDARARRVLARGLERFGFEVLEAATGPEALTLAGGRPLHAVIADLTLPYDDVFQDYVRSHRIPYIVTVTTDEGIVPPDAAAVLEKPFSLSVLLDAVFHVVRDGHSPTVA